MSTRRLRPLPPKALLFSILAQVPVLVASWPPRPTVSLVMPGVVLAGIAILLNLWAERLFRAENVGVCPFSPAANLVGLGPYRFSRNPMYLGIVLANAGIVLVTGALWNLWTTLSLAVYLHWAFVLPEEEFLLRQFNSHYLSYAFRVPRWLGLPGRSHG